MTNLGSQVPIQIHQNVLWGLEPGNLYFFQSSQVILILISHSYGERVHQSHDLAWRCSQPKREGWNHNYNVRHINVKCQKATPTKCDGNARKGEASLGQSLEEGALEQGSEKQWGQEHHLWGELLRRLYTLNLCQNSQLPSGVKTIPARSLRGRHWDLEMSSNSQFQTQVLQPQKTALNQLIILRTWPKEKSVGGGYGRGPRRVQEIMISFQSCISIWLLALSPTFRTRGNQHYEGFWAYYHSHMARKTLGWEQAFRS